MKQLAPLFLAVTLLLSLTACGSRSSGPAEPEPRSTLVYGSADYTRINPAMDEHGEINVLLFDGLAAHDGENQIIPGLAETWEYTTRPPVPTPSASGTAYCGTTDSPSPPGM